MSDRNGWLATTVVSMVMAAVAGLINPAEGAVDSMLIGVCFGTVAALSHIFGRRVAG